MVSRRHLKNLRHPQTFNVHRLQNEMRLHIKKVLNMHLENSTLDKYISSIFNLNNANPTYVFRLPDKKNRTLVFRKSDFTAAVFPNISNVNKFKKPSANLQMSSSSKRPVKVQSEEQFDELSRDSFIFEDNLHSNIDDYDDNMKSIVDENVRLEQAFIENMNSLNQDLNDEEIRENYQGLIQASPAKQYNRKTSPKTKKMSGKNEWEELGLSGWTGVVAGSKDKLPKKEKWIEKNIFPFKYFWTFSFY